MKLEHFDVTAFLRDYWQQKPLFIKNPWDCWLDPLDPDDLAGLACGEGADARLITRDDDTWHVEHGPFDETRFAAPAEQPWTLLVRAVDHDVPDVGALLAAFRFVPNWRIDDVMVSYAVDGGGVGPHFDQYDVFLIQGLGRRRWQVGARCDQVTPLLPHDELRLLADFTATEEWTLDPGDILYLPPGFAHDGVAIGDDCMTYSIGFRAPSRSELIAHWCDHLLADLTDDDRYEDPNLPAQTNPGEITAAALDRLYAMVTEKLADRQGFARWFGQYSSTRNDQEAAEHDDKPARTAAVRRSVAAQVPVLHNPASRFAFVRQDGDAILLFVDGACFPCSAATAMLAEQLCARDRMTIAPELGQVAPAMTLIARLVRQGSIAFEEQD